MRLRRISALLVVGGLLAACDEPAQPQAGAPAPPPVSVIVARAQSTELRPSAGFTGRIEAIDEVELRARVPGFLEQRLFAEGALVEDGQKLFVIEQQSYRAAVTQAEAAVAKAQAELDNAELQLERAFELAKNKNIPQAQVDDRRALRDSAKAALLSAQAGLEQAQINLSYTEIAAPVGGRIGKSAYSVGSLVEPASGPLATIVSQDPIRVSFPVSMSLMLDVQRHRAENGAPEAPFEIRLRLADGAEYAETGTIDFASNQVDTGTDTVTVRALLPNPDGLLIDGSLVQVEVATGTPEMALIVPQSALLIDQSGRYVLTVDGENKVERRAVTVGDAVGTMQAISSGLGEGDLVIVEGALKVRPGQTVQASEMAAAAGAGS